jgi:hypothetical protein
LKFKIFEESQDRNKLFSEVKHMLVISDGICFRNNKSLKVLATILVKYLWESCEFNGSCFLRVASPPLFQADEPKNAITV